MLGIYLRESVEIILLRTFNKILFVSTMASHICYLILSVLTMKRRLYATGKSIWKSSLIALPVMEGARSGPKVVVAMAPIEAMDPGFN